MQRCLNAIFHTGMKRRSGADWTCTHPPARRRCPWWCFFTAGVFGHVTDAAMEQLRVTYPWPMLAMITLPELFACTTTLAGETFTLAEGTIDSFNRTLHLRNGLLTRHVEWTSPNGHRADVGIPVFVGEIGHPLLTVRCIHYAFTGNGLQIICIGVYWVLFL
jgi:trehalose/maltose hydrolase-like predicted phosphorylase